MDLDGDGTPELLIGAILSADQQFRWCLISGLYAKESR